MSAKKGSIPWNKGLTKETSTSVRKYSETLIGRKLSEEHRLKCSRGRKGKKHTEERKAQLVKVLLATGAKTRFKKGESVSVKTQFEKGQTPWNKGKKRPEITGEKHFAWKGGTYDRDRRLDMGRRNYRVWRMAVLERDNYTCVWCGNKTNLNVDHIKSYAHYPELRYAIDNGRVLCVECHKTTDNYGGRGVKRKSI